MNSNGDIHLRFGGVVGGDVSTSSPGGLDIPVSVTVHGDTTSTMPTISLPDIPQEVYDEAEVSNNNLTGISGTHTYDPVTHEFSSGSSVVLSSGVYYFSSMILDNSASLTIEPGAKVLIYVTGDVDLKNDASINTGGQPKDVQIYGQGNVLIGNVVSIWNQRN